MLRDWCWFYFWVDERLAGNFEPVTKRSDGKLKRKQISYNNLKVKVLKEILKLTYFFQQKGVNFSAIWLTVLVKLNLKEFAL